MRFMLFAFLIACGSKSAPPPAEPAPGSEAPPPAAGGECVKSGCSGTACVEPGKEMMTTCEFKPEYACYQNAKCERQPDNSCGWTQSPELTACLANPPPP